MQTPSGQIYFSGVNCSLSRTVNPLWRNETIPEDSATHCSVSRIQGKSVTRSREGKLSAKMDPKLAQPPELSDKDFSLSISVQKYTYSQFTSVLPTEHVRSSPYYVYVHLRRPEWVLTDVMEAQVLCNSEMQVFYPQTQRENRPLSWSARISTGDSSYKNIWLS